MARRGGFSEFFSAFNQGYDTVNKVAKDYELSKLENEKESTVYTQDQAQQLEAIANAKDQDGKPYYQLEATPDGKYTVKPNFEGEGGVPAGPATIAASGTNFMGKSYDSAPTDSQKMAAKNTAMSGIMSKYGDSEGALKFQTAANQLARQDKQDAQGDQRFAWEKGRAERDQRQSDTAEADQATMREVDQTTADWFKKRLTTETGEQRAATIDDHLAASQYRASALTSAGKMEAAGKVIGEHNSQSLIKIQLDTATRDQDLAKTAAALAAGDLSAVKDFYNKYIPDGAKVLGVTRGTDGKISIQRESMDGRPMPATVLKDAGQLSSALASFKDPMAVYNWSQNEFRNNLALKADGRAGAAEGRAAENYKQGKDEKAAAQTAGVALYQETNPNATPAQLAAVKTGVLPAVPSLNNNAPAEVKLAQAMVNAGMAPDMRTALEVAITKKGQSGDSLHSDFVQAGIKNMTPAVDAVAKADEAMAAMGYTKKNGRWGMGASAPEKKAPKSGDTRPILGGPDKGKTAVFDGTGWAVKP